jgi:hypothetical protein
MTIYIDTNVLPRSGTLGAPHIAALQAVAKARGLEIVLPSLALEESVSARSRDALQAFEALASAHKRASRFAEVVLTYIPSAEDAAVEWRQALVATFRIADLPPHSALEALQREVHRKPPARRGVGGRDAAIWLTVVNEHLKSKGAGYFVSENTDDFADPADRNELHPELTAELPPEAEPLYFHPSIDTLMEALATPLQLKKPVESLLEADTVQQAVLRSIEADVFSRLGIRRTETRSMLGTGVYAIEPVKSLRQEAKQVRAYQVEDKAYALVWSLIELRVSVGVLGRTRGGAIETSTGMTLCVEMRIWLELDKDLEITREAEVVSVAKLAAESSDPDLEIVINAVQSSSA